MYAMYSYCFMVSKENKWSTCAVPTTEHPLKKKGFQFDISKVTELYVYQNVRFLLGTSNLY